ncbi:type VII secretion protein EccE [Mycolicibacterium mageritense]|uniref:type VII secretion protein EccE n=1 Tax=Mycolicibacterium mageritense TaxID=53462 RepID=UPI0011DA99DD|nr:type VII secretion protein EccE [Mycolicibacterium mageritense]TXI56443.1 MAG: type VII secretion protein EccE [Mycolicibacterium mageritense]
MRARTVTAPVPAVRTIVAAEIVALVLIGALATFGVPTGWPSVAAVAVLVAAVATVRVHGRTAAGWALWLLRGRHRTAESATVATGIDIRRGDQTYGILRDAHTATAVLELCGTPYTPTILNGRGRVLTSNTVPLSVLSQQLVQPGPLVVDGIDVVDVGFRVRRAQGYPPLYSTVFSEHPARGNGATYAIMRLNIGESVPGLALRTTVEDATAAAAERIACALREVGCRARPLSLAATTELIDDLASPLLSGVSTAHHRYLDNDGHFWSTYVYSAEDITTANLNDVWSWRVDSAVTTVTLHPGEDGRTRVSAMVRTQTPQPPALAPTAYLNTPVGDQPRAAMACVPGGPRMPSLPRAVLDEVADLTMAIGSARVLIGTVTYAGQRQLVLLPFADPERDTRILMKTGVMFARQMLLRNAAVGFPISVYTDTPQRWAGLHELEPFIEVHETPTDIPVLAPRILVKDRADGLAPVTAPTIISMPSDSSYPKGLAPDIGLTQLDDHRVAVLTATGQTKVHIATFPDEQPYLFPARHRTRV